MIPVVTSVIGSVLGTVYAVEYANIILSENKNSYETDPNPIYKILKRIYKEGARSEDPWKKFKAYTVINLPMEVYTVALLVAGCAALIFISISGLPITTVAIITGCIAGAFLINQSIKIWLSFKEDKIKTNKELSPEQEEECRLEGERFREEKKIKLEKRILSGRNTTPPQMYPHLLVNGRYDQNSTSFFLNTLRQNIQYLKKPLVYHQGKGKPELAWKLEKLGDDIYRGTITANFMKEKYIPDDEKELVKEALGEYRQLFVSKYKGFIPDDVLENIEQEKFSKFKNIKEWLEEEKALV